MSIWILALLDDIAMLADDAATMTKVSMTKTAWILWDDLAVNAKQASDFNASREIPVLLKITKWALINKIIILPFAFLLTAFAPSWVIPTILVFGWAYLAFEGTEKIHEFIEHKFFKKNHNHKQDDIMMKEEDKIKSAIFTDFILSIEIIMIALSTVLDQPLVTQIVVASIVAIIATIWVYWIVALIIRLDDIWYYFINKWKTWSFKQKLWKFLVASLPVIIKILAIVWTWAMLVVAGWLFTHNISYIHHFYESINYIPAIIFDTILWFIVGYILVIIFVLWKKIFGKK